MNEFILLALVLASLGWVYFLRRRASRRGPPLVHQRRRDPDGAWRWSVGSVDIALVRRDSGYRLTVAHKTPTDFSAGRDGHLDKPLYGPEVKTMDPDFDARVRVAGRKAEVLAILDLHTRKRLMAALDAGWTLERGTYSLSVDRPDLEVPTLDELVLPLAIATAAVEPLTERLAARLRQSDDVAVLDRIVSVLSAQPDVAVTLARVAAGTSPPWLKARALRLLTARYPHHGETIAIISGLKESPARLPADLARALGELVTVVPNPDPEGVLIDLLAHPDSAPRNTAIDMLGQCGTIERAVPALLPLRNELLGGQPARAGAAIAAIQARASVDGGRLALAEEGGGLSVAPD